jgi:hypothetical protein
LRPNRIRVDDHAVTAHTTHWTRAAPALDTDTSAT